jgi:hypothetical protein
MDLFERAASVPLHIVFIDVHERVATHCQT